MRDAMREGRYVWRAPYGYSNTRSYGKTTIILNDIAPLIQNIFEEIAMNRYSLDTIRLKYCQGTQLKRPIAKSYFYRLIRNELYAGWICKFGERHKGSFEPLISEELFAKVHQILSKRTKTPQPYSVLNPDFPLRRFFKHSSRRLLTGCWSTDKHKKYPYYTFHTTTIRIRREKLEETFKNRLNDFKIDIDNFEKLHTAVKHYLETALDNMQGEKGRLQTRINELKIKQDVIIDKNINDIISDEMCKEKLATINADLYDLNNAIINLPDFSLNKEEILRVLRAVLLSPGEVWKKASFENKIKLQWFYFPKGIILTETESRTSKICKFFKLKQAFSPYKSLIVTHRKQKSNTQSWQILLPPENDPVDTTPKSHCRVFL
jgi:site-specific DNA recombinase